MSLAAFLLRLKLVSIALACINDLVEQRSTYSVLATKKMRRVCGCLGEIIPHEHIVPTSAVPGDAQPSHGRPLTLLRLHIHDLLRRKDYGRLLDVVIEQVL
jgi:hypothetical protein